MTLFLALSVGTTSIGSMIVSNLGHPDDGTHPDDDDMRRYCYDVMILGAHVDDCPSGEVTHRRGDGAWRLVHAILDDCRDRLPGYDGGATLHPPTRS